MQCQQNIKNKDRFVPEVAWTVWVILKLLSVKRCLTLCSLQKCTRNPRIQWNWKRLTLSMISRCDTNIQNKDSGVNHNNIRKLIKLHFI